MTFVLLIPYDIVSQLFALQRCVRQSQSGKLKAGFCLVYLVAFFGVDVTQWTSQPNFASSLHDITSTMNYFSCPNRLRSSQQAESLRRDKINRLFDKQRKDRKIERSKDRKNSWMNGRRMDGHWMKNKLCSVTQSFQSVYITRHIFPTHLPVQMDLKHVPRWKKNCITRPLIDEKL